MDRCQPYLCHDDHLCTIGYNYLSLWLSTMYLLGGISVTLRLSGRIGRRDKEILSAKKCQVQCPHNKFQKVRMNNVNIFNEMWMTIFGVFWLNSNGHNEEKRIWLKCEHDHAVHYLFKNNSNSRYFAAAAINEIIDNKIDETAIIRFILIKFFWTYFTQKPNRNQFK